MRKQKKIHDWQVSSKPELATSQQIEKNIKDFQAMGNLHPENKSIGELANKIVFKLKEERAKRIGKKA